VIVTPHITAVREARWQDAGLSWGLVPTMGYLHEGHLSLVRRAAKENDKTAVTIFVNPTQFAPEEDLSTYPRDLERDLNLLAAEAVDLVFTPSDDIMYPPDFQTTVTVNNVSQPLEGAARPVHFQGVATIVAKLFNIIQPTRAYFGQKDAQQTVVLRQLVQDLNFNLELIVCPTVREADGVALSSRNAYLSPAERAAAPILFHALSAAEDAYTKGERDGAILRQLMREMIQAEPLARLEYVSAADPHTLAECDKIEAGVLLSSAVFFGSTRLIDNLLLE
jgi:pantoate--beta-alanine ligase